MDKNRIFEYGQACFQHGIQRAAAGQSGMKLLVPALVFFKNILGQREQLGEVLTVFYNKYRTAWRNLADICFSNTDKTDILEGKGQLSKLLRSKHIYVAGGKNAVFSVETDCLQAWDILGNMKKNPQVDIGKCII